MLVLRKNLKSLEFKDLTLVKLTFFAALPNTDFNEFSFLLTNHQHISVQIQLLLVHILVTAYVRAMTPTVSPVLNFTPSVQTSVISSIQSQIVDASYSVCTGIYLQDNSSSSNFYAFLPVHLSIILQFTNLLIRSLYSSFDF